jgi:hypothetical protein
MIEMMKFEITNTVNEPMKFEKCIDISTNSRDTSNLKIAFYRFRIGELTAKSAKLVDAQINFEEMYFSELKTYINNNRNLLFYRLGYGKLITKNRKSLVFNITLKNSKIMHRKYGGCAKNTEKKNISVSGQVDKLN